MEPIKINGRTFRHEAAHYAAEFWVAHLDAIGEGQFSRSDVAEHLYGAGRQHAAGIAKTFVDRVLESGQESCLWVPSGGSWVPLS